MPGIVKIGELFAEGEVFLPELIKASEAMKCATGLLNAAISGEKTIEGKVVLATVENDLHDIGKSIVAALLVANGLVVYDMGRDVSVSAIITKAEEVGADVIGTSALLTSTMIEQKKLEKELMARGLRGKYMTIIGGTQATGSWQSKIGADEYAENAVDGLNKILAYLKKRNES